MPDINTIPKAVQQANQEMEAAIAELNAMVSGTPATSAKAEDPAPGDLNATQQQPESPPSQPDHTQQPITEQQPAQPVDTDPAKAERDRNWETMYRALQGKYDAEVPRLHSEIKARDVRLSQTEAQAQTLQHQITELQNQMAQLKSKPDSKVSDPSQSSQSIGLNPDKMAEEYGEDADITVMAKLVQQQADVIKTQQTQMQQMLTQMQQIGGQVQAVGQHQAQSRQQMFEAEITRLAPNWRKYEGDQAFAQWLDMEDPATGFIRRQLAEQHYRAMNPQRVANWYNAFEQQFYPSSNPQVPQQPQQPNQPQQPYQRPNLENQIEPNRVPSDTATRQQQQQAQGGKIYTVQEIDAFYEGMVKGHFRNTSQAELQRQEQDITLAIQEGRVQGAPTVGRMEPGDIRLVNR